MYIYIYEVDEIPQLLCDSRKNNKFENLFVVFIYFFFLIYYRAPLLAKGLYSELQNSGPP
jgi:hypothetical protein